jgi:hypothetical protein
MERKYGIGETWDSNRRVKDERMRDSRRKETEISTESDR